MHITVEQVLQTSLNDANFSSPEFVSLHPAGGIIDQHDNGEYEWIPGKTQWAAPEGTSDPPERNPLTQDLQSILHLKDGLKNLHIDLCNKLFWNNWLQYQRTQTLSFSFWYL